MLSTSLQTPSSIKSNIHLDISYLFKVAIEGINKLIDKNDNMFKLFRKAWNRRIENKMSNAKIIVELANFVLKMQGSKVEFDLILIKLGQQQIDLLHNLHEEEIINLYENKDGIFAKFIKETWGARNRLLVYLNKISELVPIMLEEGYSPLKEILKIGRFI